MCYQKRDRQCNWQKKKRNKSTNNDSQNTMQKTKYNPKNKP